jgi:hypothetical protein
MVRTSLCSERSVASMLDARSATSLASLALASMLTPNTR